MMPYVAGSLLLVIVLLGGYGWYQDKQIAALSLENQNLTIELEVEQANVVQLQEEMGLIATQVGQFQEKIAQIEAERASARKQVEYTRSLFNDGRFARLVEKNPTLISLRMQKATDAVLTDLRSITE